MRGLLLAALVLASGLPLVPSASAAEPFLTDPAGDAAFAAATGLPAAAAPAGQADAVDLLALEVTETDDALALVVHVASLAMADSSGSYLVRFDWGGVAYVVHLERWSHDAFGESWGFAYLGYYEEGESWFEGVSDLELVVDEEAGTLATTVPKPYVLDARGRMPMKGDALANVHVLAERGTVGGITINGNALARTHDMMPDDGAGVDFVLQLGDEATGHLRLATEERVRVSNGGATTFVYQALVRNDGEAVDDVALALADVPEGWTGSVQSPVRVGPGEEKPVAVLMSMPFEHDHGGYSSFTVVATSGHDAAARATLRLGVLHTPIPQPAGHHSELFLHVVSHNQGAIRTLFPWDEVHMNTVADHAQDAPEAMPNDWGDGKTYWYVPLSPGLRMGLDFDLDRVGELVGTVTAKETSTGVVAAELFLVRSDAWWDLDGATRLAESDEATLDLAMDEPSSFALTLTPTEEADYVPHAPDQNLLLRVALETDSLLRGCCMPQTMPTLSTEAFRLSLPLDEYHDRLTGEAEAAAALTLAADSEVEKVGRPGTLLTYTFTLTNAGREPGTFVVDVAGNDASQGSVAPAGAFALAAGESRRVTLGVAVPAEAAEGEVLEVLLFARDQADPSRSAVARTKTTVGLGSEAVPDEAAVFAAAQDEANEAPGAGVALLLAGAAAGALARRRRTQL